MVIKILSSGQTGVDRAALDVALENDIAAGGWCAKGRQAEDGPISDHYPLVEMDSPSATKRTEANVRDADGTLIIVWGDKAGGTLKTAAVAARLRKPAHVANLSEPSEKTIAEIEAWVNQYQIHVLHVTGPRASEQPNAYESAKIFLKALLVGDENTPSE